MTYKTLLRKPKIEQHELYRKPELNAGVNCQHSYFNHHDVSLEKCNKSVMYEICL